ncbi:hypothetical protein AcW1_010190 [Taiwanofungus camphoratus]|nr:hypothetical protein AcW1_010190 [Antrodia cinnamomea]
MKHVYYGLVPSLFVVYGVVEKDNASSSVRQKNVPRFLNFHETVNGRSSSYHITPAVAAIASVSRKPTAKNARELFLPPISLLLERWCQNWRNYEIDLAELVV